MWLDGKAPEHTTQVIKASPFARTRDAAQESTVNGAIYPTQMVTDAA